MTDDKGFDQREIWKAIPGYDSLYQASNWGRIRRYSYIKKPTRGKDGYLRVMLWKNNNNKLFLVHRLISISFWGPIPEGFEINHKNGIKHDNRLINLEFVSHSMNSIHAYKTGLRNSSISGENNPHAVLTIEQINEIRLIYIPFDKNFGCRALARKFKVDHSTISRIVSQNTWKV